MTRPNGQGGAGDLSALFEMVRVEVDGQPAAMLVSVVREDAPRELREALARRRMATLTGECPCGARLQLPGRAARRDAAHHGRVVHARIVHQSNCPATDDAVAELLRQASG